MKFLAISLLLIASIISPSMASAGYFKSGNDLQTGLLKWHGDPTGNYVEASLAHGYVIGVFDALDGVLFCSPSGVTQGQVSQVVLKHLGASPETLHETGSMLVIRALQSTWPCSGKSSSEVPS